MSLKDQEGLVKMFALVSVTDYSIVGTGSTLLETRADYVKKLIEAGILDSAGDLEKTITGPVKTGFLRHRERQYPILYDLGRGTAGSL